MLSLEGQNILVKKRLMFILILSSTLILALLIRVGYIQFFMGTDMQEKAFSQQYMSQNINPVRGNIYDRNGNTLATSIPVETVSANPKDIDKLKLKLIVENLSNILGISSDEVLKKLSNDSSYETIKSKIDENTADKIREFIKKDNIKGIYLLPDTKRFYPNKGLASHVIGFTNIDSMGLQGIEQTMDKYLKGKPGKELCMVDANGRTSPFNTKQYIEPQNGLNAVLTIDSTIQEIASKAMDSAMAKYNVVGGGVVIVMDPKNGDVLAMVSKPDFDLNDPYKAPSIPGIDADKWRGHDQKEVDILNSNIWRNKAISNTYEPGSTFKSITSAAALEEGTIRADDLIDDNPVHIDTWTIGSYQGYLYKGKIPFRYGVYQSSNPVFVRVAQGLGIEKFYGYLRAFGFYNKTGIELSGEQNSIFQKKPTQVDMATAAFGQRFTITPIQLATAYAAIANGGKLMKPRVVKELKDNDGDVVKEFDSEIVRKVISKQTSDTLKDILEGVVSEGTGKGVYIKGYRIAGKTGTSETTQSDVYVASFAGIAPADNPVMNILVTFYNPRGETYFGGDIAAPVAKEIIEGTFNYLGIEKSN